MNLPAQNLEPPATALESETMHRYQTGLNFTRAYLDQLFRELPPALETPESQLQFRQKYLTNFWMLLARKELHNASSVS